MNSNSLYLQMKKNQILLIVLEIEMTFFQQKCEHDKTNIIQCIKGNEY